MTIRLGNEDAVRGHFVAVRSLHAVRDNDVNGRPTVSHCGSQFQSVHGTRHIDVGEDRVNVVANSRALIASSALATAITS